MHIDNVMLVTTENMLSYCSDVCESNLQSAQLSHHASTQAITARAMANHAMQEHSMSRRSDSIYLERERSLPIDTSPIPYFYSLQFLIPVHAQSMHRWVGDRRRKRNAVRYWHQSDTQSRNHIRQQCKHVQTYCESSRRSLGASSKLYHTGCCASAIVCHIQRSSA
ncbi:hypothetical protein P389DRAFT_175127 [Cystobasidium minutum MCA 4210]|uniref:uncharacterized protein n=1 Tax=Cystobasidium minutum MCA 4210 TaxID=1397322 RepID=UPI0034CECA88|eukprot:jgi/Rhomi1/175127/fgenesh1_kg.9_\